MEYCFIEIERGFYRDVSRHLSDTIKVVSLLLNADIQNLLLAILIVLICCLKSIFIALDMD